MPRCGLLLLCLAACDGGGGRADAGTDALRSLDAALVSCADAADCAEEPYATACAGGTCVECTGDSECGAEALGPTCRESSGYCVCADDAECEGNAHGPRCHPVAEACGCRDDRDCPDPTTCELEPYLGAGVRTCQPP